MFVSVPSEQAIRHRLAEDNLVRHGMLMLESVEAWTILLDARDA